MFFRLSSRRHLLYLFKIYVCYANFREAIVKPAQGLYVFYYIFRENTAIPAQGLRLIN
jgi:hypothetical protein